jgi:hypothetical protein
MFKVAGRGIPGSPQSFLSLRSRVLSAMVFFGCWTAFINLNPSELNSQWVFELCGHKYTIDTETGAPVDCPSAMDRWRTVAKSPGAVAHFFDTFIRMFIDTMLGWRVRALRTWLACLLHLHLHAVCWLRAVCCCGCCV